MTTVREINDPEELDAVSPLWNELLERTAGASFFHSLEWLQTYWKYFGAQKRLRVLVVSDGDQPLGILPLVVRISRRSEPVRILTYPLDSWGNCYSPIGPDCMTTLKAGLMHIRHTPRDWQLIDLPFVNAHVDANQTPSALAHAGFKPSCETQDASATVNLAAYKSWDAYLATRKKNCRKDLRKKENRLALRGAISYIRYRTHRAEADATDPRWDLYDACEAISQVSWQGSSRTGAALNRELYRAYYRDCHLAASRFGAVDVSLLSIDEQPVAYQYAYHYRGYISALKTFYDPEVAFEGAGTIVQARTIADSFLRGDHTFNLGPEYMEYKRNWLTDVRPMHRYTYFPYTAIAAQLVRAKRAIERWWRTEPSVATPSL